MAGAGYKLFNTGDVLTAAQVNTYLQEQTVMVFASSAARTSALSGVLAEGMMSYLQDTNSVEVYNGSSWVNVGNAGDITEVQAGVGISIASGTGPIPVITNSSTDLITTAGDLLYGTAADTVARLGIGTAGQVLKVNSGATAPEWGTIAAGGGKVLQVIQAVKTDTFSSNSATMVDITGVTATITPSLTSSKVLVMVNFGVLGGDETQGMQLKLLRGATVPISNTSGGGADTNDAFWSGLAPSVTNTRITATANLVYLDSPSSTSALTYKVQMRQTSSAQIGYVNQWALNADVGGVATITLMEIGA